MKVSICTITYNQAAFIGEALDSFLQQQTDFEFEIVVSDDASTDGTRDILKSYQEKFPEKIRLLLQEKNIGMVANFYTAIAACKGDYIALCEGDDYFTSSNKLQIQAAILDRHSEYAICFHKAKIVFTGIAPFDYPDYNAKTPEVSRFTDLINGNFIHTPTCMFRNHLFQQVPDAFLSLKVGDWPLHLLNALKGDIYFIPEELSAYRVSSAGYWSARNHTNKIEYAMKFLSDLQPVFDQKYAPYFEAAKKRYARYLLKLYWRNRNWSRLLAKGPQYFYSGFIK